MFVTGVQTCALPIYRRDLPDDLSYGAISPVNRGFGLLGDRLFLPTADAHLLALDARTGVVIWDVVLADYKIGYAATAAPLIVKDKIIVGFPAATSRPVDFSTRTIPARALASGGSTPSRAPASRAVTRGRPKM